MQRYHQHFHDVLILKYDQREGTIFQNSLLLQL